MVSHFKVLSSAGLHIKYLPEGGIKEWLDSNVSVDGVSRFNEDEDDDLSEEQLVEILKKRPALRNTAVTLAYGQPDFLPFEFLERGFRCGTAVCQLRRKYSIESIENEIITSIQKNNFNNKVINAVFLTEQTLWGTYQSASEALNNSEIRQKFIQHMQREPIAVATGFMVGRDYLLTNNHVINDSQTLNEFTADFLYDRNVIGQNRQPVSYEFKEIVHTSDATDGLDYTIVEVRAFTPNKLKEVNKDRDYKLTYFTAGDNFGWLPMLSDPDLVAPPVQQKQVRLILRRFKEDAEIQAQLSSQSDLPGEPVNLIQHPRGRQKEIVIFNNKVQKISKKYIQYEADADLGSSGCAVFNSQWQLVALHHAALLEVADKKEPRSISEGFGIRQFFRTLLEVANKMQPRGADFKVIGQLGIRSSSIVADLKDVAQHRPEVQKFLQKTNLFPSSEVQKNKVFILAGRRRSLLKEEKWITFEMEKMVALQTEVAALLSQNLTLRPVIVPLPTGIDDETKIREEIYRWINNDPKNLPKSGLQNYEYQPGDVAIELLMNQLPGEKDSTGALTDSNFRGSSAYYFSEATERRIHGEFLLRKLTQQIPKLPNRGAHPDDVISEEGLGFCRKLFMPSLILFIGFVSNAQDRAIAEEPAKLTPGIVDGLTAWIESYRPEINPERYMREQSNST